MPTANVVLNWAGGRTESHNLDAKLSTIQVRSSDGFSCVTQQQAQTERQKLEQAKALADTQPQVVAAERKVAISRFDAEAAVHAAEGQARSKTINAEADACVTLVNGEADATVVRQVGEAESAVVQLKTNAVGAGAGNGLVDALLGNMLAAQAVAARGPSGNMP